MKQVTQKCFEHLFRCQGSDPAVKQMLNSRPSVALLRLPRLVTGVLAEPGPGRQLQSHSVSRSPSQQHRKRSGASAISSGSSVRPFRAHPERDRQPCGAPGAAVARIHSSHRAAPPRPSRAAHRARSHRRRSGTGGPSSCSYGSQARGPEPGQALQPSAMLAPPAAGRSPGLAAGAPTGRRHRTAGPRAAPAGRGRGAPAAAAPVSAPLEPPASPAAEPAPTCSESC